MNVGFGVSLMLFPVFGLLADMWFTRYRMIQASFLLLATSITVVLIMTDFNMIVLTTVDGKQTTSLLGIITDVIVLPLLTIVVCDL